MLNITVAAADRPATHAFNVSLPVVFIIDDDIQIRQALCELLGNDGRTVESYSNSEEFLESYQPGRCGCLLIDATLPGLNGIELLQQMRKAGDETPAIIFTGHSNVPMAVKAMKAGAFDFIEKPISCDALLASIALALVQSVALDKVSALQATAARYIASLTERERQIMVLVLAGHPSKNIAADLGISQRTVENHRASIMKKTGSKSLPALARASLAAAWDDSRGLHAA